MLRLQCSVPCPGWGSCASPTTVQTCYSSQDGWLGSAFQGSKILYDHGRRSTKIFTGTLHKKCGCTLSAQKGGRWMIKPQMGTAITTKSGGLQLPSRRGWLCLPLQISTYKNRIGALVADNGLGAPFREVSGAESAPHVHKKKWHLETMVGDSLLQGTPSANLLCKEACSGSELGFYGGCQSSSGPYTVSPACLSCGHL